MFDSLNMFVGSSHPTPLMRSYGRYSLPKDDLTYNNQSEVLGQRPARIGGNYSSTIKLRFSHYTVCGDPQVAGTAQRQGIPRPQNDRGKKPKNAPQLHRLQYGLQPRQRERIEPPIKQFKTRLQRRLPHPRTGRILVIQEMMRTLSLIIDPSYGINID
jgi:hypothetical protein